MCGVLGAKKISHMNRILTGTLLVLLAAVGFAFLPILTKLGYQHDIAPLALVTLRFVVATVALWSVWPLWRKSARLNALTRKEIMILLAMGALYGFVALTGFLALDRVPAGTYSLVFYTYPALVALISLALGERLPAGSWVAVGLALGGCMLVIGGRLVIGDLLGLTLLLLNASSYAIYLVIAGALTRGISGLVTGIFTISGTALALVPLSLISGIELPGQSAGWLVVLGLGLVATAFPILTILSGIARLGASNAAILSTVEPIMTVILAAVILGEQIENLQYLGGGLILVSVILLQVSGRIAASAGRGIPASEQIVDSP